MQKVTYVLSAVVLTTVVGACEGEKADNGRIGLGNQSSAVGTPVPLTDEPLDEGGQVIDDGTGPREVQRTPTQRISGTGGLPILAKPSPLGDPLPVGFVPPQSPRQRVLAEAGTLAPDSLLSVSFVLAEVATDWKAFRQAQSQAARDAFKQAREAAVGPGRQAFIAWLNGIGAKDVQPLWIANVVHARVPAKFVAIAANRPEVIDITPANRSVEPLANVWAGVKSTDSVGVTEFYSGGITGHHGGKSRPRIQIGVLETDRMYGGHAAFNRASPLTGSRLQVFKDCTGYPCLPAAPLALLPEVQPERAAA